MPSELVFGPGDGPRFSLGPGYTSVFKATSANTGGHLSMEEQVVPPGFDAPPHRPVLLGSLPATVSTAGR